MTSLELLLFGGFQVRAAGRQVHVPGRKERALLAFLAMPAGRPHSRDRLCALLWGERSDRQAHDSLKQALHRLRASFDPALPLPIRADRAALALDPAAVAIDVQEFEHLIDEGTPQALERAAAIYRGDLLDGLDVREAVFEEWLLIERQRLRNLERDALTTLLDVYMGSDERRQAGTTARRLLVLDPIEETAHRALMRIFAAQGQTAQALNQYVLCCNALRGELGIGPEAETERLHESIKQRRASSWRVSVAPVPAKRGPPFDAPEKSSRDAAGPTPSAISPLASGPSIAVLPFANMTGDPRQDHFADGLTEDIITELARFRRLFVVARNPSFQGLGKEIHVKQVGRELGVHYVVQGRIRSVDRRLRITAQLIDAATGNYLWAERYDRNVDGLLEAQDEVAHRIVATLAGRVEEAEIGGTAHKRTEGLPAYECLLRGIEHLRAYGPDENRLAREHFERAVSLDARLALAHAYLALALLCEHGLGDAPPSVKDRALAAAMTGLRLDPNEARCHQFLAQAQLFRREYDSALSHLERSLALNPNDANGIAQMGGALAFVGHPEQGIELIRRAMRLDPFHPDWWWGELALAYCAARRYPDSLEASQRISGAKSCWVLAREAACYAQLGRRDEAHARVTDVLRLKPEFRISAVKPFYRNARDAEHVFEGMRNAGLPR